MSEARGGGVAGQVVSENVGEFLFFHPIDISSSLTIQRWKKPGLFVNLGAIVPFFFFSSTHFSVVFFCYFCAALLCMNCVGVLASSSRFLAHAADADIGRV